MIGDLCTCKKCTICNQELPLDNFYKVKTKKGTEILTPHCKKCHLEKCKSYRESKLNGNEEHLEEKREKYHKVKDKYNEIRRQKRKELLAKGIDKSREKNLKRNYGITIEQYNNLLEKQGGSCAICKCEETAKDKNGKTIKLAVDHDHKTGEIRGLLCGACNKAVGMLKDDSQTIIDAYFYIKDHE